MPKIFVIKPIKDYHPDKSISFFELDVFISWIKSTITEVKLHEYKYGYIDEDYSDLEIVDLDTTTIKALFERE